MAARASTGSGNTPIRRNRSVVAATAAERSEVSKPSTELGLGTRLRRERLKTGKTLRALASEVGISPSALSQFENGHAQPSVKTLYSIVSSLAISLDQLFDTPETGASPLPDRMIEEAICHPDTRHIINLESGVQWQRLTPAPDTGVDFLYVIYEVGGSSASGGSFVRHSGREYGFVQQGRLRVIHGFQVHELSPGDSITFDSSVPHRLETIGDEPAHGIWFVLDR